MYKTLDLEIYRPVMWTCPFCGHTSNDISERSKHEKETVNDPLHQRSTVYTPKLQQVSYEA